MRETRYQTTEDIERGTWLAPAERKAARKQDKAARKEAPRQAPPSQWALQTALLGVRLPGLGLFPKRGEIDAKLAELREQGTTATLTDGSHMQAGRPTATRTAGGAVAGGVLLGPVGLIGGGLVGHAAHKKARVVGKLVLTVTTPGGDVAATQLPPSKLAQAIAWVEAFNSGGAQ